MSTSICTRTLRLLRAHPDAGFTALEIATARWMLSQVEHARRAIKALRRDRRVDVVPDPDGSEARVRALRSGTR
jgi:hypothetical protein